MFESYQTIDMGKVQGCPCTNAMSMDEYEEGARNLIKGIQGLAIQLPVCVCISENERSVHYDTICTHDWALRATRLRQKHSSEGIEGLWVHVRGKRSKKKRKTSPEGNENHACRR